MHTLNSCRAYCRHIHSLYTCIFASHGRPQVYSEMYMYTPAPKHVTGIHMITLPYCSTLLFTQFSVYMYAHCNHRVFSLQFSSSESGKQSGSSMMRMWSLFSGKTSGVSESILRVYNCIAVLMYIYTTALPQSQASPTHSHVQVK